MRRSKEIIKRSMNANTAGAKTGVCAPNPTRASSPARPSPHPRRQTTSDASPSRSAHGYKSPAMDSPDSALSVYDSDDFPENVRGGRPRSMEHTPDMDAHRPSKRLRLNHRAPSDAPEAAAVPPLDEDESTLR